jgi:hypothetical protein
VPLFQFRTWKAGWWHKPYSCSVRPVCKFGLHSVSTTTNHRPLPAAPHQMFDFIPDNN